MKDAALFEQQIKALIDRFGKDLKPEVLQIRSGKLESGQTQTFLINPTLSMMQIVPNWVIADNRLILTTNPNLDDDPAQAVRRRQARVRLAGR